MAATLGTPWRWSPGTSPAARTSSAFSSRAVARFGGVDVWVNNAGRGISRPSFEAIGDQDLELMVRDNTRSALHGMQVVLPHFKARGKGVLVNVSSMLSRIPDATLRAAYSAAKAALNSLTESLRFELAKDYPGIRVVLALPGVVATDFGNSALGGGPDSRSIPGAQSVEAVARIIGDGLFTGPVDLYTRPESFQRVLGHVQRLAGLREVTARLARAAAARAASDRGASAEHPAPAQEHHVPGEIGCVGMVGPEREAAELASALVERSVTSGTAVPVRLDSERAHEARAHPSVPAVLDEWCELAELSGGGTHLAFGVLPLGSFAGHLVALNVGSPSGSTSAGQARHRRSTPMVRATSSALRPRCGSRRSGAIGRRASVIFPGSGDEESVADGGSLAQLCSGA